jgi:hypothetical protein
MQKYGPVHSTAAPNTAAPNNTTTAAATTTSNNNDIIKEDEDFLLSLSPYSSPFLLPQMSTFVFTPSRYSLRLSTSYTGNMM